MKRLFWFLGLMAFCGLAVAEPISTAIAAVTSVLGTAGTAAAAGALGSMAANKVFGGKGSSAPKTQTAMPTADDEAIRRARQRQIAEVQSRSGRASTILSDGGAKLGG